MGTARATRLGRSVARLGRLRAAGPAVPRAGDVATRAAYLPVLPAVPELLAEDAAAEGRVAGP